MHIHEGRREFSNRLVAKVNRVLVLVEATGWGKGVIRSASSSQLI